MASESGRVILREYFLMVMPHGYSYPEDSYDVLSGDKCYRVVSRPFRYLWKPYFEGPELCRRLYSDLSALEESLSERLPYPEAMGLVVTEKVFAQAVNSCTTQDDMRKWFRALGEHRNTLLVRVLHDVPRPQSGQLFDAVLDLRGDQKKMGEAERIFFDVVQKFHDTVLSFVAPYAMVLDLSYRNLGQRPVTFFADESGRLITHPRTIAPEECPFWAPRFDKIADAASIRAAMSVPIPLERLLISRARVLARETSYSMAIIHAVTALEVAVEAFLDQELRYRGVTSEAIRDFRSKFGLSVRVKAVLKLLLPNSVHSLLSEASAAISYRNKILHEGLTNKYFTQQGIDVSHIVESCVKLVSVLATRQHSRSICLKLRRRFTAGRAGP